jgi:omega-amidase
MQDLKITTIQTSLHWENKSANIEMFSKLIASIQEPTDLIVLPEMFTTGFTMNAKALTEDMEGETVKWMLEKAEEKNAVVCGSFIAEENGKYFNRLVCARPNGSHVYYDKRHLFRMAEENNYYTEGTKKIIVELKGWKICPLVCYDLRFPVWSRNRVLPLDSARGDRFGVSGLELEYDVLLYVANWPERRSIAWKTLLPARAIENQCYVVGVNGIGKDGKDISYSGDSGVINAKGELISTTKSNEEKIETITISSSELAEFRKQFPVFLDSDDFILK